MKVYEKPCLAITAILNTEAVTASSVGLQANKFNVTSIGGTTTKNTVEINLSQLN